MAENNHGPLLYLEDKGLLAKNILKQPTAPDAISPLAFMRCSDFVFPPSGMQQEMILTDKLRTLIAAINPSLADRIADMLRGMGRAEF